MINRQNKIALKRLNQENLLIKQKAFYLIFILIFSLTALFGNTVPGQAYRSVEYEKSIDSYLYQQPDYSYLYTSDSQVLPILIERQQQVTTTSETLNYEPLSDQPALPDSSQIMVDVISLAENPDLIKSGELFKLEGSSLVFTPLNENNYSWQRQDLQWEDEYISDEIVSIPGANPGYVTEQINIPFKFQYFDSEYNSFALSANFATIFSDSFNFGTSCSYYQNKFSGCDPQIIGLGRFSGLPMKAYIKSEPESLLITFITDQSQEQPFVRLEIQMRLRKNGQIVISYNEVDHASLAKFTIGLLAGIDEEFQIKDLNNSISGSTSGSVPTGIVSTGQGVELDKERLQEIIYTKHNNQYFDDVITANDFTHLSYNIIGNSGPSLTASSKIFYNDVEGTGWPVSDCQDDSCEIDQHVKAIMSLNNFLRYDSDFTDTNNDLHLLLLHEFGHKWIAYINATAPDQPCVNAEETTDTCHWKNSQGGAYDSQCYSPLFYYAMSLNNSEAKFCFAYTWLDLYLMGLVSEDEASTGYDIAQIVEKQGKRIPSYEISPKTFNLLPVFITQKTTAQFMAENQDMLELYQNYLFEFAKNYNKLTLKRGEIRYNQPGLLLEISLDHALISQLSNEDIGPFVVNMLFSSRNERNREKIFYLLPREMSLDICQYYNCDFSSDSAHFDQFMQSIQQVSDEQLQAIKQDLLLLAE
jgi:hypothetical protein